MVRIDSRLLLPLVAAAATLIPVLQAPAGPQEPKKPFTDTTTVTLVEVPVQVLHKGEPVRDLTADDFEILDGKKKRKIVSFERIDLETLSGEASRSVSAAGRRNFLFLFDLSFSEPSSLERAQDAAIALLEESFHSSDLGAVAVYRASLGARLLLNFTSDRGQIELAIQTLGVPELVDRSADSLGIVLGEARQGLADAQDLAGAAIEGAGRPIGPRGPGAASGGAERRLAIAELILERVEDAQAREAAALAANQRDQVRNLATSFSQMAALLDRVPGKKHVLLLSEGFDAATFQPQGSNDEFNESIAEGEIWNVDSETMLGSGKIQGDLDDMLDAFRRSDCVIHSVDIGGTRGIDFDRETRAGQPGLVYRRGEEGQDSLFYLANETGGSFHRNHNDLGDAMKRVLDASSVTYVLSFQVPEAALDGSHRPLEVRLKNAPRGTDVLHRTSYRAGRSSFLSSALEQRLELASLVTSGKSGGALAPEVVWTALPSDRERVTVPFLVEIDGPNLLAGVDGNLLTGELHAYVFDAEGSVVEVVSQNLGFNLVKLREALQRSGLRVYGEVALPPGRYEIRILIRGAQSGRYGLAVEPIEIPSAATALAAGPLLLEEPADWVVVQAQQATATPYPFRLGDRLLIPSARPTLTAGEAATLWIGAHHLAEPPQIAVAVRAADGRAIDADRVELRPYPGEAMAGGLVAQLETSALAPGEYDLEVALTDRPSGRTERSTLRLSVER